MNELQNVISEMKLMNELQNVVSEIRLMNELQNLISEIRFINTCIKQLQTANTTPSACKTQATIK